MAHSTPNSLDYQKHALDLQKAQAGLARNRAEMAGNRPGALDAEIGLIDDFRNASQTRKPGWRALLDGMAGGLKYGLKSADAEKKRAAFASMERMLGSFEEAGIRLQRQNEKNALRQENMETRVIPSVAGYLTYLQNSPTYDEAFSNLGGRVEQIRAVMPEMDGDLVALNPRNYEVGIFRNRKTRRLTEIPLSSLLPPDFLKGRPDLNTYGRARDAHRMDMERRKVDALGMRSEASMLKAGNAQKPSLGEEETRTYLGLHRLLKNPDIDPTSGAGTQIQNWVAQNVPFVGERVGKGLAEKQAYSQLIANLKGLLFKKYGYRNQAEFENIRTLSETLSRPEALKFVEAELLKRGIPVSGQTSPGQAQAGEEPGGNVTGQVKILDPATGQVGLLSPEQAKIAISRGGVRVE